jgi:hypothetical protein
MSTAATFAVRLSIVECGRARTNKKSPFGAKDSVPASGRGREAKGACLRGWDQ